MLTPDLEKILKNHKGHGFWSVGQTEFRVINNTLSAGPALVVFRTPPPPPDADSTTASDAWVPWAEEGMVRLLVSRGTLVPARPGTKPDQPKPSRKLASALPDGGPQGDVDSGVDSDDEASSNEIASRHVAAAWEDDPSAPRKRRRVRASHATAGIR